MTTQTQKEKRVNGVNIYQLHDTIKAVKEKPELGSSRFRIRNQWKGADRNVTTVGHFNTLGRENQHKQTFTFDNGEPEVLFGQDQGANPVEFLLHALAGCVTTATVTHAAARGINIRKVETTIEGDLDLQGLFGLSPDVRPGYQNIRVIMSIESDAEGGKLEELKKLNAYSPVLDSLRRPVNVDVQIQT